MSARCSGSASVRRTSISSGRTARCPSAWMTQLKPTFGKAIADTAALAGRPLGVDAQSGALPGGTGSELRFEFLHRPARPHGKQWMRPQSTAQSWTRSLQPREFSGAASTSSPPSARSDDVTRVHAAPEHGPDRRSGDGFRGRTCSPIRGQARLRATRLRGYRSCSCRACSVKRAVCHIRAKVELTGAEVTGVKVGGGAVIVGEGTMGAVGCLGSRPR